VRQGRETHAGWLACQRTGPSVLLENGLPSALNTKHMPTKTEIRRRRDQSRKDKAKHQSHADRNLDRIYAEIIKAIQPTQTSDQIKAVDPAMRVRTFLRSIFALILLPF